MPKAPISSGERGLKAAFSSLNFIIVTHVFLMGQAQELMKFLLNKVKLLVFIGHPLPLCEERRSYVRIVEDGKELNMKSLPITGPEPLLYILHSFLTFYFVLRLRRGFHIYYGANNLNALVGVILRRLGLVKAVIFNTVDYVPNRFKNRILNGVYHLLDKLACYNCDQVWNLSPAMVEGRKRMGLSTKKSAPQITVPIGCNFKSTRKLSTKEINRYDVVYAGSLEKERGVELIVEAMPEILRFVPKARLIIIGRGSLETELKNKVRKLGLEGHVRFMGYLEDHSEVEGVISKCALGLAPYPPDPSSHVWYADPMKPKQYMCCGLPVVMTRVPRVAYEIERREAGVIINYDKTKLVVATIKLLKDDELYERLRKNAVEFASEFEWSRVFEDAFHKLLD